MSAIIMELAHFGETLAMIPQRRSMMRGKPTDGLLDRADKLTVRAEAKPSPDPATLAKVRERLWQQLMEPLDDKRQYTAAAKAPGMLLATGNPRMQQYTPTSSSVTSSRTANFSPSPPGSIGETKTAAEPAAALAKPGTAVGSDLAIPGSPLSNMSSPRTRSPDSIRFHEASSIGSDEHLTVDGGRGLMVSDFEESDNIPTTPVVPARFTRTSSGVKIPLLPIPMLGSPSQLTQSRRTPQFHEVKGTPEAAAKPTGEPSPTQGPTDAQEVLSGAVQVGSSDDKIHEDHEARDSKQESLSSAVQVASTTSNISSDVGQHGKGASDDLISGAAVDTISFEQGVVIPEDTRQSDIGRSGARSSKFDDPGVLLKGYRSVYCDLQRRRQELRVIEERLALAESIAVLARHRLEAFEEYVRDVEKNAAPLMRVLKMFTLRK